MEYTAEGLVKWAEQLLAIGAGYVYGTYFSSVCTEDLIEAKRRQYCTVKGSPFYDGNNGYTYAKRCRKWIGKLVGDCVGLMKSYYWTGDDCKVHYAYEGRKDVSANGLMNMATVFGDIASLPEKRGVCLWYDGHVGVYAGDGYAIESRGVDYGVVKTKVKSRPWAKWFYCPYVDYSKGEYDMKKGDKGEDVKLWQIRLVQWNPNALPKYGTDGSFGKETEEWTNKFKKSVGLKEDGIVDAKTWNKMIDVIAENKKSTALAAIKTDITDVINRYF